MSSQEIGAFMNELGRALSNSEGDHYSGYMARKPFVSNTSPVKGFMKNITGKHFCSRPYLSYMETNSAIGNPFPNVRYSLDLKELFTGQDQRYMDIIKKSDVGDITQLFFHDRAYFTFMVIEAKAADTGTIGKGLNQAAKAGSWLVEHRIRFFEETGQTAKRKQRSVPMFQDSSNYAYSIVTDEFSSNLLRHWNDRAASHSIIVKQFALDEDGELQKLHEQIQRIMH